MQQHVTAVHVKRLLAKKSTANQRKENNVDLKSTFSG